MEQNTPDFDQDEELALDFTFQAPINQVFDALTLPKHLKHWNCPNHLEITSAESTPEVGGNYSIRMTPQGSDGPEMMFVGTYLRINQPEVLSYTHAFSPGNDAPLTPETTITIGLRQLDNETVMEFRQTGFTNKQAFDGARMSWPSIYENLSAYLENL